MYFTLGNIDPALRSKLEAINLLMLFSYSLLTTYSFDMILKPFLEELTSLNSVSNICDRTQEKWSFGGICQICVFGITGTCFQRSILWCI